MYPKSTVWNSIKPNALNISQQEFIDSLKLLWLIPSSADIYKIVYNSFFKMDPYLFYRCTIQYYLFFSPVGCTCLHDFHMSNVCLKLTYQLNARGNYSVSSMTSYTKLRLKKKKDKSNDHQGIMKALMTFCLLYPKYLMLMDALEANLAFNGKGISSIVHMYCIDLCKNTGSPWFTAIHLKMFQSYDNIGEKKVMIHPQTMIT